VATSAATASRVPRWAGVVLVVGLIALAAGAVALYDRITLRAAPPVEALAFERTVLRPGVVEVHLRNDGRDPVTIAQVLINDAYWQFTASDPQLERLETATLTANYPWEEGLPLRITIVTSTGVTIPHEIEAAASTPEVDASAVATYALLGVYIGLLPVLLGLFAFPWLRRMSERWLGFFLAFTIGLLVFLLVDTVAHGFELAGETAASLDGVALFALGAVIAVATLVWLEGALGRRGDTGTSSGLALSYLVAAGIGLHNLGEGLAVGAALAAGEAALGAFLIIGFAAHNTTEGLAIVAPLGAAAERPHLGHFIALGAVAGVPTIFGAWAGGFAFSAAWGALAFGVAAGAIAQVVWTVARQMRGEAALGRGLPTLGFVAGLLVMYVTALFVVA